MEKNSYSCRSKFSNQSSKSVSNSHPNGSNRLSEQRFSDQVRLVYKADYPDSDFDAISRRYHKLFDRAQRFSISASSVVKIIYETEIDISSKTPNQRRKELSSILSENGCSLRSDSKFCMQFIAGCYETIEEVTATMILTKELFSHGNSL